MREEKDTADRLAAYSDAVFAVIVTIMVLELRAPDQPAFSALWPTALSYAVSYLFIAIIWINHHYLMRLVGPPTGGADHSWSLRFSRPLSWWRSSRRALASG